MRTQSGRMWSFLADMLSPRFERTARRRRKSSAVSPELLESRTLLTIDLLSVTAGSTSGGLVSENPQISRDARFVAFQSKAEDLAITGAVDGNSKQDVFVRNLLDDTTTLISVNTLGRGGAAASWSPSISDDGRFVAFSSFATDLVTDAAYVGSPNVFLRDRDTDKDGIFDEPGASSTILLSRSGEDLSDSGNSPSGGIVLGASYPMRPIISGNGSTIVFASLASNLLDPADGVVDAPLTIDLYSATPGKGARLVSVNSDGTAAGTAPFSGSAWMPSISYDGTRIAFESGYVDLVEDDELFGYTDIFVRDLRAGKTTRVSVNAEREGGDLRSFEPIISRDGRHVVFGSLATNLVADDINARQDVFVHDLRTGRTSLVSRNRDPAIPGSTGSLGSPPSSDVSESSYAISDNGRFIVFASLATNLLDPAAGIGDTNSTADVFWFDRDADADGIYDEASPGATSTKLVSINAAGTATADAPFATGGSTAVSISRDGRYVIFTSPGTDLIEGGTSGTAVYLRDMFAESTSLVGLTGVPGALFAGVAESGLALSPLRAAFASMASTLDPTVTDSNIKMDVFSYEAPTDIIATTSRGDGFKTISVGYRIENKPAPVPFEVGVYRSADGVFDVGLDELLDTFMISGSGLEVGKKMLTLPIGSGPGEIALPGAGATETDLDYQILFVFDHLDAISEFDTDPFSGDNAGPLLGSYHPAGGAVFVHGRQGPGPRADDRLVVTEPDATTITVSNGGPVAIYATSDVTGIRFRGHSGDDSAMAAGTPDLLLGGSGKDSLFAGAGDDLLGGGPGADALFGEAGFDLFYDGMGDDAVDLGPDGGEILTTPGSDDIFTGGSGESTLNFSLDDQPITLDLSSASIQQVDPLGNTIQLIAEWQNFVGSPFNDTLRVRANGVPGRLNGGSGSDQLIIDAEGDSAFYDGFGTITFGAHSSLTIENFESLSVINAAPRIVDDSDPVDFAHDGFFDSNPGFPQGFNSGVKFSAAGDGHSATWTFRNLVPGNYAVAATWTNAGDRAKDSPFTIFNGDANDPIAAQIDVNQESAPNDFSADGFAWEFLTTLRVSGTTVTVQLTDDADQFVCADAIRLFPIGSQLVIDDRSAAFTGGGTLSTGPGRNGGQRVFGSGIGSVVGTWDASGLTLPPDFVPGLYVVSATWSGIAGGATNSPFTVSSGTNSFTSRVDQSVPPDDFTDGGTPWERLGQTQIDSFFEVFVTLNDDANGFLAADAIRIEPAATIELLYLDPPTDTWLPIANGGAIDFGQVPLNDVTGAAERVGRFAIRNNGSGDLELAPITVNGVGFSLLVPPVTNILRRFEIAELELQLLTSTPGAAAGQLVISSNDFANALFQINIAAQVVDDSTPPTVSIISPPGGTMVVAGLSVPIIAEADDDIGIERVEFLVNGQPFVDDTSPFSFDFPLSGGQLPPVQLDVQVTAFDLSGDSAIDTGTFRVEPDAPPQVQLQVPPNSGSPFLEDVTLPVIVDADDDVRVARVDLFVNGTLFAGQNGLATEFLLPQMAFNGPVTVFAIVTDIFGQISPSPPLFFNPVEPLSFTSPALVPPFQMPPTDLLMPLFQWNPHAGAQGYEVFIRNLQTQQATISPVVVAPEFRVTQELQQGVHRIWVRAIDAQGTRLPWSDPHDLMIDVPNPPSSKPVFAITTSAIDPTPEIRLLPETESVGSVELSTFDTVDVFIRDRTSPQQLDIVLRGLRSGVIELEQGLRPDQYLIWVRRGNADGELGLWSDPLALNITTPPLGAPVITGPTGTQDVSPPKVTWSPVNFADQFSVFIRRTDQGQSDIHVQGVEGLSWTPQSSLPNGDYLVWVRAFSSAGISSPWSQSVSFSINVPVPQQVILLGPSGNIATGLPTFSWQPVAFADRYVLWLTNLDTNEHPVLLETSLRDNQYIPSTPLPLGNYRFWVRAINSVGVAGLWSQASSFTII